MYVHGADKGVPGNSTWWQSRVLRGIVWTDSDDDPIRGPTLAQHLLGTVHRAQPPAHLFIVPLTPCVYMGGVCTHVYAYDSLRAPVGM
jgi:hypothetical protein